MRFIVLILLQFYVSILNAGETWTWVKFNETDAGAFPPMGGEAELTITNPEEPRIFEFAIYFQKKYGCLPIVLLPSIEEATELQLRIDERKIYRPQWTKWQESSPGVLWASFISANTTEDQVLKYVKTARSFLDDLSEGNTLRTKLEPSGDVRRWMLNGSKRALDAAMGHCLAAIEDQQYFPE
jgi:hypothetical protein